MAAFAPTQGSIVCNLGLGALQDRRTNASLLLLYSVRAAPIHLNGNPQGKPILARRKHGTCMVADATYAWSRGLGAVGTRANQINERQW